MNPKRSTLVRLILPAALGLAIPGRGTGAEADAVRPWDTYRTIMWVGNSAAKKPEKLPLFFERLREMGINTVTLAPGANPAPVVAAGFSYYVENIVNRGLCLKFNSKVRDWDKFVTAWSRDGRPESLLVRDYCLDDPGWRDWARGEVRTVVNRNRANAPLAYDLRDELSVTISANPFDYDFNPIALDAFRSWLQRQYRDLGALNAEWETGFPTWVAVRPFTTDEIKHRMASGARQPLGEPNWGALRRLRFDAATAAAEPTRWNFAPWADFRTYMDEALARSLEGLRGAVRELDPATPVGIEGTQMPSAFGGYDLWRLAQVLDWVEPYDIGNARDILGSFMPGKPIVTTVFEKETPPARRRLWHLLLEGDRGCIVWWSEDTIDWASPDYALTAKATALAPVLREMQSPVAGLFRRARRVTDPVFLVYSQPSIQADWLLESMADGPSWIRRFSSFEAQHNGLARDRAAWMKLFQDLGYTPQFIATENLAGLARTAPDGAVLVLSNVLALSAPETDGVVGFLAGKRRVMVTDGPTAAFDEHARFRRPPGPLAPYGRADAIIVTKGGAAAGGAPVAATSQGAIAGFGRDRLRAESAVWYAWAERHFGRPPAVRVPPASHVRVHRYELGPARLVAFERNISYHMSEDLRQAGGNESLEQPGSVTAELDAPAHVYDLRTGGYAGKIDRITFTLEPWQPSLFALLPEKIVTDDIVEWLGKSGEAARR